MKFIQNKKYFTQSLMIGLGCLAYSSLHAASVDIELAFDKRPAKQGLVYIFDEQAPAVQGIIDQKDKDFVESLVVTSPNESIVFKNSDSVDHNIYVNEISDKLNLQFDVGLMPSQSEQEKKVDWAQDTLVRISCKIHPKMKSYIANIQASEYTIFEFEKSQKNYTANLKVAEKPALVKILLNKYDPIELTMSDAEPVTVDLMRKGKKKGTATLTLKD